MTWRAGAPQGNEARKVRFDVLPYLHGGLDLGCGPCKIWPHLVGLDSGKDTRLFGVAMRPDVVVPTVERLRQFADGMSGDVFSSHTLEHIVDWRAALAEWWRVVSVGRHLVLYLPHRDLYPRIGEPGANPDHKHDFAPGDILQAMAEIAPDVSLLVDEDRSEGDEYSFLQVYRKEAPGHGQRLVAPARAPGKHAGVLRFGGHGDALWASSVVHGLKAQGYHVTVYASSTAAEILRHDPHIDVLHEIVNGSLCGEEEQLAFYAHEAVKFDRWVNLIGSVENRLLYHATDLNFYLPHALRHRFANANYLELVHDYAQLPHEWHQKFYPSAQEALDAQHRRAQLRGPLVVINPAGSGPVKYWPYAQRLMELLAARGVYSVVLGDVQDPGVVGVENWGAVVGMDWPVRQAVSFALQADAVVATESLIANAVAFEPMLKVVTLSHSSNENLTKHWINTAAIEAAVPCHPCHRIHPPHYGFCSRDTASGAAACQAYASADVIAGLLLDYLEQRGLLQKEAA